MAEETKKTADEEMEEQKETQQTAEETLKDEETEAQADGTEAPKDKTVSDDTGASDENITDSAPEDKKGLFKKKKPDKKDEKIKELEEKALRQMAEFENFRKRTEKEKSQMFDMGAKSIIEKILPVIDNFERGLSTLTDEQRAEPFAQGIEKVYQQLQTELDSVGVKPIEAVGHEFDPNLHNAVMQTESEEYESGTVAQELLKGYTYHDTVVRHSMVSVVS